MIHLMILDKISPLVKIGATALNFWLDKAWVLKWLKSSFKTPDPKVNVLFGI